MTSANNRPWMDRLTSVALIVGVAIAGWVIWETVVWWWQLPKALLPTPGVCLAAGIKHREALLKGALATGTAAVAGLLAATLVGSLISIVLCQSKKLYAAFFPYVMLLQTVPIVAIAPLLIIWSGYNFRTVLIVTVIVCLFPIVNSVTAGLQRIDRSADELLALYGAGRWQRLVKLQIPSAVADLMVGVKTSSGLAVIAAIIAEFFVGKGANYDGLGELMTDWQGLLKTDALIAALFVSGFLGLALFGAVHLVSTLLLRRWI